MRYEKTKTNRTKVYKPVSASWWRHKMETFSALMAFSDGNLPVTGEMPSQRPVARSFGVFCDLRLNKRMRKQSRGWWSETPSRSLCSHCHVVRLVIFNRLYNMKSFDVHFCQMYWTIIRSVILLGIWQQKYCIINILHIKTFPQPFETH